MDALANPYRKYEGVSHAPLNALRPPSFPTASDRSQGRVSGPSEPLPPHALRPPSFPTLISHRAEFLGPVSPALRSEGSRSALLDFGCGSFNVGQSSPGASRFPGPLSGSSSGEAPIGSAFGSAFGSPFDSAPFGDDDGGDDDGAHTPGGFRAADASGSPSRAPFKFKRGEDSGGPSLTGLAGPAGPEGVVPTSTACVDVADADVEWHPSPFDSGLMRAPGELNHELSSLGFEAGGDALMNMVDITCLAPEGPATRSRLNLKKCPFPTRSDAWRLFPSEPRPAGGRNAAAGAGERSAARACPPAPAASDMSEAETDSVRISLGGSSYSHASDGTPRAATDAGGEAWDHDASYPRVCSDPPTHGAAASERDDAAILSWLCMVVPPGGRPTALRPAAGYGWPAP